MLFAAAILMETGSAQPSGANYDESKVPEFTLPSPLTTLAGEAVATPEAWFRIRRPEIISLFEKEVYGRTPGDKLKSSHRIRSQARDVFGGKGTVEEVTITFSRDSKKLAMELLLYLPKVNKAPIFLGLNFNGNQTVQADPEIHLSEAWMRNSAGNGVVDHRATESSRGNASDRWPVEMLLDRGYGLATIYYGDIDPDFDDGFQNGIHPFFYEAGQTSPAADEWGSIGAWAWGLSRAVDFLEKDVRIDRKKISVIGHSRLGKTALWAGALDERFALVVSNNSGCGGAALSRRQFGETVTRINNSFPHWFCKNFRKYNGNESELPVDQHLLIGLIAPRPVYIASAAEDLWADPRGEFLSGLNANPVYELLGLKGLTTAQMPGLDQPVMDGRIGYHIRPGEHDLTPKDWKFFLDFADRHLGSE